MDRRNAGSGICLVMAVHSLGVLRQTERRYVLFSRVSHVTVQTLKQAGPQEYMEEGKQRANASPLWPSANFIHTHKHTDAQSDLWNIYLRFSVVY